MDLFSIPILSILISVVIAWALFGIACSMIHETVIRVKAERGRFMKKYLLQQLADDVNDINWGLELYRQAPVALLSRDIRKPPDEIDPGTFATALISAVANSTLVLTKLQAVEKKAEAGGDDSKNVMAQLKGVSDPMLRQFKAATVLLRPSDQISLFSTLLAEAQVKAGQVLVTDKIKMVQTTDANIYDHLLEGLKEWNLALMQRLSLWYTKITHKRLFWLGLILAALINVDSIQFFIFFNQNPKARTILIDYYQHDSAYLSSLTKQLDSLPPAKADRVQSKFMQKMNNLADATG